MNPHFFTAPFYFTLLSFAFIWFRVQGSGFRVQGSGFGVQGCGGGFAAMLDDGILVSQPSPLGNAIKLSGRTFLAPHRGSCPKG